MGLPGDRLKIVRGEVFVNGFAIQQQLRLVAAPEVMQHALGNEHKTSRLGNSELLGRSVANHSERDQLLLLARSVLLLALFVFITPASP